VKLPERHSRIGWSPGFFWVGVRFDEPIKPARASFHPLGQNYRARIVIFRDGFKSPVFLFLGLVETLPTGSFDLNNDDLEAITPFKRSFRFFVILSYRKKIDYPSRLLTSRSRK
jgi:hypothetical protein